jgi:pyridoxamine 5'-phosphate oxidase
MPSPQRGPGRDPIREFKRWYAEAARSGGPLPEAMALATATRSGIPTARMVLFRGISDGAFLFFTNYRSRKAAAIAGNPRAALVFHWPEIERQVLVEGTVRKTTRRESDRYFRSRPRGHRLGSWASPQSAVVPDRAFLEERVQEIGRRYAGRGIPRPPYWGGFRLVPQRIEFWQGRPNRLHDRHCYTRRGRTWEVTRLAP